MVDVTISRFTFVFLSLEVWKSSKFVSGRMWICVPELLAGASFLSREVFLELYWSVSCFTTGGLRRSVFTKLPLSHFVLNVRKTCVAGCEMMWGCVSWLSNVSFRITSWRNFLIVSAVVLGGNPVATARVDLSASSSSSLVIVRFVCSSCSYLLLVVRTRPSRAITDPSIPNMRWFICASCEFAVSILDPSELLMAPCQAAFSVCNPDIVVIDVEEELVTPSHSSVSAAPRRAFLFRMYNKVTRHACGMGCPCANLCKRVQSGQTQYMNLDVLRMVHRDEHPVIRS